MVSYIRDGMSFTDIEQRSTHYSAPSHTWGAPAAMSHPLAGTFRLVTFTLFDAMEGPVPNRTHCHDVYHIVIFEEAANAFILKDKRVASHRGLCVLTQPGESHHFPPLVAGNTIYHELTFQFANMAHPPTITEWLTHLTGIPLPDGPLLVTLAEAMMQRLLPQLAELRASLPVHSAAASARLHHAVMGLLLFVAQAFEPSQRSSVQDKSPAEAAHNLIGMHFADQLSLHSLARKLGVTPAHLGRCFKAQYGISPGHYRDTLRLQAAKNLLRHSDLLIKTIALELGYPDSSTFSKAFSRHYNCSPLAFRQRGADPMRTTASSRASAT
jgi:AraC-like DNA-binding protein